MESRVAAGTAILLFRRDLRVADNPALLAALQAARYVVPVFIWSPEEEGQFQPGRCSKWWLKQSLKSLSVELSALGSRLIVRKAHTAVDMLLQLVQEAGATAVYCNHLFDPISLARDHDMKQHLTDAGITCRSYNADLLYEPWTILDSQGEPYGTFATFWGKVQSMLEAAPPAAPWPTPTALPAVNPCLLSDSLDDVPSFASREQEQATGQLASKWTPGCDGGMACLDEFLRDSLAHFSHEKARVDRCSSSRLSPWIRAGSVSIRVIYHKVLAQRSLWLSQGQDHAASCKDFIQQLAYREYSRYLSFHFPFMHERPLLGHLRCVPWNLDQAAFKAWKMGMTGYPLIDAGMKQLWSTGWMHNRLRVVCGVFAVKHLLLPWQWGLKHYWDQLLDADLESDALGWQYISGGLTDAPPFPEIMDIVAEAVSFDPAGEYVRRWLPVLARLPAAYVHAPWTAPQEVLDAADVELGFNYPKPIITQQAAATRLASVAALVQRSLNQQPLLQQQPGSDQPPYVPPTRPRGSFSMLHHTGADMQQVQQHSNEVLLSQQHGREEIAAAGGLDKCNATAAAAAAGFGASQMALAAGPAGLGSAPATGLDVGHGAAAIADEGQPWQQRQQHDWQVQALENHMSLRRRRPQWRHGYHNKRHRHGQRCNQHGTKRLRVDPEASGDDYDHMNFCQDRRCQGSDESEVNSSTPLLSEALPTACSGVLGQQDDGPEARQYQRLDVQQKQQMQGNQSWPVKGPHLGDPYFQDMQEGQQGCSQQWLGEQYEQECDMPSPQHQQQSLAADGNPRRHPITAQEQGEGAVQLDQQAEEQTERQRQRQQAWLQQLLGQSGLHVCKTQEWFV